MTHIKFWLEDLRYMVDRKRPHYIIYQIYLMAYGYCHDTDITSSKM